MMIANIIVSNPQTQLGIKVKALVDTGAQSYILVNPEYAERLFSRLNLDRKSVQFPYKYSSASNHASPKICFSFNATLDLDRRRIRNVPLVISDTGHHDMIIGIRFMSQLGLMVDSKSHRFVWPKSRPITHINPMRVIPLMTPLFDPKDQDSMERRELRAKNQENLQKFLPTRRPPVNIVAHRSRKEIPMELVKMHKEIDKSFELPPKPIEVRPTGKSKSKPVDYLSMPKSLVLGMANAPTIASVSNKALHHYMKRDDMEFFISSIDEMSTILKDRGTGRAYDPFVGEIVADEDFDTAEMISRDLPKAYRGYEDVFSKRESNKLPPHRSYDHNIELEAPLPSQFSPLYRQSTQELEATKEYIVENLQKGFIAPSTSGFASPVLFVKKPNGSLRFCVDYRKLNHITKKDPYPLPRMDELFTRMSDAVIFTKLDIRAAFNRIRMDPSCEEMTTFRTKYGCYKCKVLPFGLCNGPATYQRYMNDVLMDYLDDFCVAYLDDILIWSRTEQEHHQQVKKVLTRLREAGLQADIKKSEFDVNRTRYLGYILTTEGLEIDPEKVEPLRNWKRPYTVTGVKSFTGFCGFYRQFIANFGEIALPLTRLQKPSNPFEWTEECQVSFDKLRNALLQLVKLYHYQPQFETKLETDASDMVVGGVMSQLHPDGKWYPLGFYSKTLSGPEINWEIHDKELFAIIEAFKRWRPELASTYAQVKVFSDHRALEYFMLTKVLTAKQVRWMEFLTEFNFKIIYHDGLSNSKADILSRREQDISGQEQIKRDSRSRLLLGPNRLDERINAELADSFVSVNHLARTLCPLERIEEETEPTPTPTRNGPAVPTFNSIQLILDLKKQNIAGFQSTRNDLPDDFSVDNEGILLYKQRMVLERHSELTTSLIHEAHTQISSAHPGGRKTYQLLAPKYYWRGMEVDCRRFVDNCTACQLNHARHTKKPGILNPLPIPNYPMQHICMDFKEFPPDKHGYDSILVIIDRLSKATVTIPCHKTITARQLARLYIEWIYRFGHSPETIISDRGPQFISSFWIEFCRIIGVKIKLATAYHKETDGQTEIMNKYIDLRLRPYVNFYQDNWSEMLPMMDRVQLTMPHASIGMEPYQLLFGMAPRTSWDWKTPPTANPTEEMNVADAKLVADRMHSAWKLAKANMEAAQQRMVKATDAHRAPISWEVGSRVYLSTKNLKKHRPSRKLSQQWEGPYKILERTGPDTFRLELPAGTRMGDVFHADILKACPDNPLPGQAAPEPDPEQIIEDDKEWEIDHIVACELRRGNLKYRIQWTGFDPDFTWYWASDVMYSPHKLRQFHDDNPSSPGPPRNLALWLKAYEDGMDNYDHLIDNKPAPRAGPTAMRTRSRRNE